MKCLLVKNSVDQVIYVCFHELVLLTARSVKTLTPKHPRKVDKETAVNIIVYLTIRILGDKVLNNRNRLLHRQFETNSLQLFSILRVDSLIHTPFTSVGEQKLLMNR